jgi:hypothetical protein
MTHGTWPQCSTTNLHPQDIEIASLSIRGGKITSLRKDQLKKKLHNDTLCSFIKHKESWNNQIFESVNWRACDVAFWRLSKNLQVNVSKACFKYWHTGARHSLFYQESHPWCMCKADKENLTHILMCPSLDASLNRTASSAKLKQAMSIWQLPTDFWIAVEKGIAYAVDHKYTPNT